MKLFKTKKTTTNQQILTRTESLACVPQKSPAVTWDVLETGDILLEYPLNIRPFFLQIIEKFSKKRQQELTKKLQLDKMGSTVWDSIDGERDVKTIIKLFAADTGISLHESEISVTTFFRELGRRGLVQLR